MREIKGSTLMCDVRDSARTRGIVLPFHFGGIAQTMVVPVPEKDGFGRFMRPRLEALRVPNLTASVRTERDDLAGWVIAAAERMAKCIPQKSAGPMRRNTRMGKMLTEGEYGGYTISAVLAACFVEHAEVVPFGAYLREALFLSTGYKALEFAHDFLCRADSARTYQGVSLTFSAARKAWRCIRTVREDPTKIHVAALAPEPAFYDPREDGWNALAGIARKRRGRVIDHIMHTSPDGVLITEKIVHDADCATAARGGLRLVAS